MEGDGIDESSHRGEAWAKRARDSARRLRTTIFLFLFASIVILIAALSVNHDDFTWKSWLTIEITLMALTLLLHNHPPECVMLGVTAVLLLLGIITPDEAIKGMGSASILAIGVLFAVAKGVEQTGAVELLLSSVLGSPTSTGWAIARLSVPVCITSAFMNNTPVVAMMIPVVESWSARTGIPASKLLIPLSFSSMLGGMCTLLGTSTNLILQDLAAQCPPGPNGAPLSTCEPPFEITMFSMSSVGVPIAAVGILVMSVFNGLMPTRANVGSSADATLSYTTSFRATAAAEGRSASAVGLAAVPGAKLVQLQKDRQRASPAWQTYQPDALPSKVQAGPLLERPLSEGDVLVFQTSADGIAALRKFRELVIDKQQALAALGAGRRHRRLFEASLAVSSPLVGEPLDSTVALVTYNCAILAHRPFSAPLRLWSGLSEEDANSGLRVRASSSPGLALPVVGSPRANPMSSKKTPLLGAGYVAEGGAGAGAGAAVDSGEITMQQGDTIVIEAPNHFAMRQGASSHFSVTRELKDSFAPRFDKASDRVRMQVSGAILLLMVILAATNAYVIFSAALFASMLLITAQCLTIEEALGSIKGRVIIAICATYGLGAALQKTGVASAIASGLVALGLKIGNIGLLAMLFLCTAVLSCVVSNQATVILLWPVINSIKIEGLHLGQFAITLMMGASTAFITPIGYQTSLMVFGPGNYVFGDFVKIGGLITLFLTPITALLVYYTV